MPSQSNSRIDRVFQGYETPANELLSTIIISLDDHYESSSIQVVPETRIKSTPGRRLAGCELEIEGRKFSVRIEEL